MTVKNRHIIPTFLFSFIFCFGSVLPTIQAGEDLSLKERLYDDWGVEFGGFFDVRAGFMLQNDVDEKDLSLGETRMQLELGRDFGDAIMNFKTDLLADGVTEEVLLDIRELNLAFFPADSLDIKVGRQVLTWGTGDMIFINDMFPKDWQSFFIGREDNYLKSPSNAVKASFFLPGIDLDLAYIPLFEGSEYVSGERLSYYNPMVGRIVGRDMIFEDEEKNRYFSEAELAARISKNIDGVELALYGYSGFWQEPEGIDPLNGLAVYPRLNVWGASARSTVLGGIGNMEFGYYDSTGDEDGRNPFVRPSEYRFLAGFEHELGHELTGAFQYYLEVIDQYENYLSTVPTGTVARDEYRHLLTLRLTKLMMDQNLILSLFTYYSPSDNDGYVRSRVTYKVNDHLKLDGGLNYFWGEEEYTFWGRFEQNSNAYLGIHYSF